MKKVISLLSLLTLVVLTACGNSDSDGFPVAASHTNLQGIWVSWNDQGHFEFFDFVGGQFLQGYVKPEAGIVHEIRVGAYHFHGDSAHGFFNWGVYEAGEPVPLEEHFWFNAALSSDETRLRITDSVSHQQWELYYMGQDLHRLTHEVGTESTFFEGIELAFVVDAVWGLATLHEMPHH